MGRHDRRIRQLERAVKGRHANSWQARLARRSYEELRGGIVRMAAEQGYPGSLTAVAMGAVLKWLHEQALAAVASLPEEEQPEWRTQFTGLAAAAMGP